MANTSFAQLKRNSKSSIEALSKEASKLVGKATYEDDKRYWKPTVDKAGNGSATIRFLPAPENEEVPFVRVFKHSFKGPTGQWYIEDSLTTINKADPVSDYNTKLWKTEIDENKNIARDQKRKQVFISNIYVVNDPAVPENDGKVFLYEYGVKIFDKLNEAMHPVDDGDEAINPFDLFDGANFKLRIRNVEVDVKGKKVKFRNYDKSQLMATGPLLDDEDEMEVIWKQEFALAPFVDPAKFKTYDQLKARLNKVLDLETDAEGSERRAPKVSTPHDEDSLNPNFGKRDEDEDETPKKRVKAEKAPLVDEEDEVTESPNVATDDDDEDQGLQFFRDLAKKK